MTSPPHTPTHTHIFQQLRTLGVFRTTWNSKPWSFTWSPVLWSDTPSPMPLQLSHNFLFKHQTYHWIIGTSVGTEILPCISVKLLYGNFAISKIVGLWWAMKKLGAGRKRNRDKQWTVARQGCWLVEWERIDPWHCLDTLVCGDTT